VALTAEDRQVAREALRQSDEALAAACEIEFFIGGGPGGQHRNKTASAVRLRHVPSGVTVVATERRSQAQNRATALQRLRQRLLARSIVPKPRHKTAPSRAQKLKRLEEKRRTSERKASRRSPFD
jgi:protein subunit release factor A